MGKRVLGVWMFLLAFGLAAAKDKPLVAIILYQGDAGPAYVQVSGFGINGVQTVSVCTGQPLDNNGYKKLGKVALMSGMVLERDANGVLSIISGPGSSGGTPTCIVPANLKLEKNRKYSLKDLVDLATISGPAVSKSTNAAEKLPNNIQNGMQIRLVDAPDQELAEYLRAARAQSIPLWTDYVRQYSNAPHAADARKSLVGLVVGQGTRELAAYKQSVADSSPDFGRLKNTRLNAEQALKVLPGFAPADKLRLDAETELQAVLTAGRNELNAYVGALNNRTAGYAHLGNAQAHLEHVLLVDPAYAAADKLKSDIYSQQQTLESTIAAAEALTKDSKFDQAYTTVVRFKSFSGEVPRISNVVDAAFKYRRDRGRQLARGENWEPAIKEYRRALEYRQDAETANLLKQAETELGKIQDADAAQKALDQSRAYTLSKQFVEAYQALEVLPETQRKLVAAEMDKLKPDYVLDLDKRGTGLYKLHVPIRGSVDETNIRQAFDYFDRAVRLTGQEGPTQMHLEMTADKLSEYYLRVAKRLLDKPRGSGVGLGWLTLKEAERFKPENDETRNQITKYTPEFETHARLSVAVRFRDQTSRRDSPGFADQLADTVATGLESAGLPSLKATTLQHAAGDLETDASGPFVANFRIEGNIVQHRVDKNIDNQSMTSHYRSGYREVKNPGWVELRRQLDAIQKEYDTAKDNYTITSARTKNQKILSDSKANVDALAQKVDAAKRKLDEVQETQLEPVIETYKYMRRTIQLNAVTEVSFRLSDPMQQAPFIVDTVKLELPKTAVVLENVKSEDTDGIVEEGTPPDEFQLLTQAEEKIKNALVKKLADGLRDLPPKILQQARDYSGRGDKETAAERYILYLNATEAKETQERIEARDFLRKEFNVSTISLVR